jgi:hypothetical protein
MTDPSSPHHDTNTGSARATSWQTRVRSEFRRPRVWLFVAMLSVLLLGLLVGTVEDESGSRWFGLFNDDDASQTGQFNDSTSGDPDERGVAGGGAVAPADTSNEAGVAGGGGSAAPGGSSTPGGTDSAAGTGAEATQPPPPSGQPPAPSRPVAYLDEVFGESMFPDRYPGLELVNAFDYDDVEVTATYKDTGTAPFDIVRITVQRTESQSEAQKAVADVKRLFPVDPISYAWGGRGIGQSWDASHQAVAEPILNLAWVQGPYAIDMTVYAPYGKGVSAARAAALTLVGSLEY